MLGTAKSDSLPRIIVGLETDGASSYAIVVDGEGRMGFLAFDEFTLDWRYDPQSELWSGGSIETRDDMLQDPY